MWRYHPFSQRNKTTKRAVEVEVVVLFYSGGGGGEGSGQNLKIMGGGLGNIGGP